jgi:hypothetical protein
VGAEIDEIELHVFDCSLGRRNAHVATPACWSDRRIRSVKLAMLPSRRVAPQMK